MAIPLLLVTAVAVSDPLNAALAPLPGAVNVTVTPLNKLPPESSTVACKAVANVVPTVVLCSAPIVADTLAGDACPSLLRTHRKERGG